MPVLQGVAAASSPTQHVQYATAPSPRMQHRQQQVHSNIALTAAPHQAPMAAANQQDAYQQVCLYPCASQPSQLHVSHQQRHQQPVASNSIAAGYGMPVNSSSLPASNSGPSSAPLAPGPGQVAAVSSLMPTTAASLMREGPRDFTVIKSVGDGSFGTVCLADWKSPLPSGTMLSPMQHPTTRPEYVGKRLVAIKRMKKPFKAWGDCLKLKELKSLLDIPHHPNIIPLYDAFLDPSSKELHFVFECMEGNLYQLTKSRKGRPLAGGLVASIFQQIIHGLDHIHKHGYFHRDMKPENLLITTTGLDDYPSTKQGAPAERDVIVIVKLADFGLARETASKPPYTEYVSTRWYRAPEVLLRSRDYSNPVDMWALGTILAELVNLKPLFPGESEVDQVLQICEVLGNPSSEYGTDSKGRIRGGGAWERGIRMAASVGFQWPKAQPIKFSSLFSSRVPMELITCIEDLLRYDPALRATTAQCMQHSYFKQVARRLQPLKGRGPSMSSTKSAAEAPQLSQQVQQSQGPPMVVDPTAQREALPPSHSNLSAASRPAFGEGQQANYQRVPFYRPPQQKGSGSDDRGDETHRVYRGGAAPEANTFPVFPQPVPSQSMDVQQYGAVGLQDQKNTPPAFYPERAHQEPPSGLSQHAQQHQNERKKGWGTTITSVFFSENGNSVNASSAPLQDPSSFSHAGSQNPSFALSRPSIPNTTGPGLEIHTQDQGASASSDLSPTPLDPKKVKKEAEKAAKQAEKTKRLAQEKAARDRARAVMQKRNQILAASTIKEQVEWLSSSSPSEHQSEKARGKQPVPAQSSFSPSQSPMSSFTSWVSPNESNSSPHTPYSPGSGMYSPGFYSSRQHPMAGSGGPPLPAHLMEMRETTRPISVQSYQTGDSDPGPQGRRVMAGYPNVLQRQSSASSLSSGLDIMAQQQRNPYSLQHNRHIVPSHCSAGRSVESLRSDGHHAAASLESQLVSNMENMTAAERQSGSVSPALSHPVVGAAPGTARTSISRQGGKTRSRASSIQRAGSASPLHHPIAPRFHPYGMTGHPPPSSHSQSSSHSHYSATGIHLPSLQLSLEDEHRRVRSYSNATGGPRPSFAGRRRSSLSQQRPTLSRGSVGSSSALLNDNIGTTGAHSPVTNHHAVLHGQHYVNGGDHHTLSSHSGANGSSPHQVNPMWGGNELVQGHALIASSPEGMSHMAGAAAKETAMGSQGVNAGGNGQDTRLPPFSSLMAAADASKHVREVDEEDTEMVSDGAPGMRVLQTLGFQSVDPRWQGVSGPGSTFRR